MELLEQLGEMGVFGLTIPESYSGMGMNKVAMCVVTEELSRGYIGVGSLGTRNEIAAELIMHNGTEEQKQQLAAEARHRRGAADRRLHRAEQRLRPRAHHDARGAPGRRLVHLNGAKTWITHAVRADLMTLLARTNPNDAGASAASPCSSCRRRAAATSRARSSPTRA